MLLKGQLVVMLLVSFVSSVHATELIYSLRPESVNDPRTEYPVKLLELLLQKSAVNYDVRPSTRVMLQGRALREVEKNSGRVDIVWSMTTKQREQRLLPVRIPIYKGLIGWRLPLVRKQNIDLFKNIRSIDEMKPFLAGQEHDWPDIKILRASGLRVISASNYEGLFKMLAAGRFQYFPRSIAETWIEADVHASKELVVENNIALHYQAAVYYFVNKNNTKLAASLTTGFEKALADGSFEKLFRQYHEQAIHRSDLEKRTVIKLENPLLPMETPLDRKELWYSPE